MPNQFNSPEGDLENYFVTESWLIDQWVGDTLWVWGQNSYGQLGINDTNRRCTPVTTSAGGANWKQVSTSTQTAAIKIDGTLWTWGKNSYGQLGVNDTTNRCTPVTTFAGGTNWKQVSCGGNNTSAIKTDGTLWIWGSNLRGQLGVNDTSNRTTPVTTFAGGTNWKQVACGSGHIAAIKTDGTLWTWGYNEYGQLGINVRTTSIPYGILTPVTTFAGGTNWKQVACGSFYTAAIKTDGTLWTWGGNGYGQLGVNTTQTDPVGICTPVTTFAGGTNWKQISAGNDHTAAIKTDGTLWTWGSNAVGQVGNFDLGTRRTPVTTFVGGTNWKQVACSFQCTAAIKTDGSLWTWGGNSQGYLAINDTTNRCTPVTAFAGGNNWKQVSANFNSGILAAVTSGTDPTYFIS